MVPLYLCSKSAARLKASSRLSDGGDVKRPIPPCRVNLTRKQPDTSTPPALGFSRACEIKLRISPHDWSAKGDCSARRRKTLTPDLLFSGRKRIHDSDKSMSRIAADRIVGHLERSGYVVMKTPPSVGGGDNPGRRGSEG